MNNIKKKILQKNLVTWYIISFIYDMCKNFQSYQSVINFADCTTTLAYYCCFAICLSVCMSMAFELSFSNNINYYHRISDLSEGSFLFSHFRYISIVGNYSKNSLFKKHHRNKQQMTQIAKIILMVNPHFLYTTFVPFLQTSHVTQIPI